MSPFDAPGTYSLLQYTELAEGIWYPRGGFHKIVSTLVTIATRHGATFHLSTPVTRVLLTPDGTRATGVLLPNGTSLTADVVILNADLVHSYTTLLPSTPSATTTALQSRPHSCSSISLYWALNRKAPALGTHNIFLADEYRESFASIFDRQQLPRDLSFYINVPSRIDPTAAPETGDAVVVLVPCGNLSLGAGEDWDVIVGRVRDEVKRVVKERTGEDLGGAVTWEGVNTPETWRDRFNLHHGAILGLSHDFWFIPPNPLMA